MSITQHNQINFYETVADANAQAVYAALEETGQTLPTKEAHKWRATVRTSGTIPGMPWGLICVATDGILGLFVGCGEGSPKGFIGHVTSFKWNIGTEQKVEFYDAKEKKFKQLTVEKSDGAPPPLYTKPKHGPSKEAMKRGEKLSQQRSEQPKVKLTKIKELTPQNQAQLKRLKILMDL